MTELEPEMLFILLFHNGVDHMLQYESYLSEWVSGCCFTPPRQFFSYITVRTSKFVMRWWWGPLYTRPIRLVRLRSTKFIGFGLTRSRLEPTIYSTQGEHAKHYATDAVRVVCDANYEIKLLVINSGNRETAQIFQNATQCVIWLLFFNNLRKQTSHAVLRTFEWM